LQCNNLIEIISDKLMKILAAVRLCDSKEIKEFAVSNRLLLACVFSGLLDENECYTELDNQRSKRVKTAKLLSDIHDAFFENDIKYTVMKGFAFERAIYGDINIRDVGDVDILIRENDALLAHEILCKMGYQQQLGPSSGSIANLGRAKFVVRVSSHKYIVSETPLRRFPHKDAYCPYVKLGHPTVELHDCFRGLPCWYINEAIDRACGNKLSLMDDRLDILVFLLVNTYENAESFYSNCFDGKIALRDFFDLACYFYSVGNSIDFEIADALIRELKIDEAVGIVMYDLDCLLQDDADLFLRRIQRFESYWKKNICERINSNEARTESVFQVIRREMKLIARKAIVGLLDECECEFTTTMRSIKSMLYSLHKSRNDVILRIYGIADKHDGSCLIEFCFFPTTSTNPHLYGKVLVLLEDNSPVAYCRGLDRISDGFTIWSRAGVSLAAYYEESDVVTVVIPREITNVLLHERETVITACVYDRKYDDMFWARSCGKNKLTGNVPIGHLSFYCGLGIFSISVEFSFGRCAIAIDDLHICELFLAMFESAAIGVPIDCDNKPVRRYIVTHDAYGAYTVDVDGVQIGRSLSRNEASSSLIQDITDWVVSMLSSEFVLAHTSSNSTKDGVVLCMGQSCSGKTSLSLALAKYWPLRGDEFSCIDLDSGTTWTERMPVNVKMDNEFVLDRLFSKDSLKCESKFHGGAFYFCRKIVRSDPSPSVCAKIRAIIFPSYDKYFHGVELTKVDYKNFIQLILGSLLCEKSSSGLFRKFLKMVSAYDIKLVCLRYSDAVEAASAVVRFIDG
jgi:hypothetical protein